MKTKRLLVAASVVAAALAETPARSRVGDGSSVAFGPTFDIQLAPG
jgi:hypothetical protein